MSILLVAHILAGSLLLLLAVVRFLIVVLAHRSPATLRTGLITLGAVQVASGFGLIVVEQASVLHVCFSALAALAFLGITEAWLQIAYKRRYSEGSKVRGF